MPYGWCPRCGLRTYYVTGDECPRCAAPLGTEPRAAPEWSSPEAPDGAVERVLALARRELRMDAAVLTEVRDGRETVLWTVGNGRLPAVVPGLSVPLEDTICHLLLAGTIDGLVPDAAADDRVRDLPVVHGLGLGAYIGVPLTAASIRRYMLCCLAREARPELGEADLRFLRGLVESARPAVEAATRPG